MKKLLGFVIAFALIASSAWAIPPMPGGGSSSSPECLTCSASDGEHYLDVDNSGAFSGTPAEGMVMCRADTDLCYRYNGSSWVPFFMSGGDIGSATGTSLSLTSNLTGLMPSVVLTHASGVHDGADDAAVMTDSGESFTVNAMVGMIAYNVTDGSSCTITANAATTITCTLAGGTDNNWDTNDVWQVGPGPSQSGSVFYVTLASTIRHPATAGYLAGYYVDGAVTVTVEVADAMTIEGATASAIDAGDTIDSPATAGSFIYLHNKSATIAKTHGKNGTWTDGGAS